MGDGDGFSDYIVEVFGFTYDPSVLINATTPWTKYVDKNGRSLGWLPDSNGNHGANTSRLTFTNRDKYNAFVDALHSEPRD